MIIVQAGPRRNDNCHWKRPLGYPRHRQIISKWILGKWSV